MGAGELASKATQDKDFLVGVGKYIPNVLLAEQKAKAEAGGANQADEQGRQDCEAGETRTHQTVQNQRRLFREGISPQGRNLRGNTGPVGPRKEIWKWTRKSRTRRAR